VLCRRLAVRSGKKRSTMATSALLLVRIGDEVSGDPDQIMLASGTQHALWIVLSAIFKTGDQIWYEDPGYPAARKAIEHCGHRPVPVPVDQFGMRVARGRAIAPSARAAYVTPSHQFPLGVQMSMTRRLELLDWAKDADAFVLEDDYDSEFRYDGAPLLSLAGIDHLQRVIYIGTFAKTLFPCASAIARCPSG
jgi:GntR family transcriptional regulator/MocR family aminotransferase